mmetsp:Transcript_32190/g.96484  ORF Transcript_32190/g.96484 Transcript_32190/m.96484 type:complete len:231 (-) Transcript_32190:529-1221(-)
MMPSSSFWPDTGSTSWSSSTSFEAEAEAAWSISPSTMQSRSDTAASAGLLGAETPPSSSSSGPNEIEMRCIWGGGVRAIRIAEFIIPSRTSNRGAKSSSTCDICIGLVIVCGKISSRMRGLRDADGGVAARRMNGSSRKNGSESKMLRSEEGPPPPKIASMGSLGRHSPFSSTSTRHAWWASLKARPIAERADGGAGWKGRTCRITVGERRGGRNGRNGIKLLVVSVVGL